LVGYSNGNMSDINEMNLGPRWYVAHTYSGYENKVKANLEKIVENRGLGHLIFDVQIPVDIVTEHNGNISKRSETKRFPSYVLIKMIMTDESWHVVRNISGVTGFVGPGSKPVPLTDEEVAAINLETHTEKVAIAVGDPISIIDGPFVGFSGKVQEISQDGTRATVIIETAGREFPVIMETKHVKKQQSV
jgi:transcriptional antiterminator NusG